MEKYITKARQKLCIDNNLNPAKVNVIHPTKDKFTQPLSVQEILDELEVSKVDYYRPFSISKDEYIELLLKRQPNSCYVNSYFLVGLKVWRQIWTYNLSLMSIRQ